MQLLAMPLLGELAAITGTSPATAAAGSGGANGADAKGAAPFGQLLAQLQGEGGKALPPTELAAVLGISVEQLQQALAQLRQALADYNRQQTGASGIMPALVNGSSDGETSAVNEDGEAFLLWLADQQQGLAGEVDPALAAALQQWLNEQQAEPVNAGKTVGGEQPLVRSGSEAEVRLVAEAESAVQQAGAEASETSKVIQADSHAAPGGQQMPVAAVTDGKPQAAVAGAEPGEQQMPVAVVTDGKPQAAVAGAEPGRQQTTVAAASGTASQSANMVTGQDVTAEVAAIAASDKRQTAPVASSSVTTASVATTTSATITDGSEQASSAATEADAADVSGSDGTERRATATTVAAGQQRGSDNSNNNGTGNSSDPSRDSKGNNSSAASAPMDGEDDQSQRQVGERLSQWQFQWERASNEAASGITSAAASRDSHASHQLLGTSPANLQPSRLMGGVGQEQSPLLRQFSADPAAALGPQVQVMVARSLDQMTVRLDPQELGSMSIKVQVGADQQVHVQFQVTNPATRDLVEQSLPRLRELLGDAGVQLGDAQVGQQQRETRQMAGDSGGRSGNGRGGAAAKGGDSDTELEQVADQVQRKSGRLANGRLDFYV
ncbi:MAG: flagellar hook-length control protein FliK [Gammaproteobacteria bacterium]|nr:flagellar hook-length control protein FliK [Gammaproteobacteria bacterium]